jgi:hypothetical protein
LSESSVLPASNIGGIEDDIRTGRKLAYTLKSVDGSHYDGLCAFGREEPSVLPGDSLALTALSLEAFPNPGRTNAHDVLKRLFDDVRRFCMLHGYRAVHCVVDTESPSLPLLMAQGFEVEGLSGHGGKTFYRMVHEIPSVYVGDPFSGREFLEWFAGELGFQSSQDAAPRHTSIIDCNLTMSCLNRSFEGTSIGELALPVQLALGKQDRDGVPISLRVGSQATGIHRLDVSYPLEELRAISGSERMDFRYWPPPPGGASVAVEVRTNLFAKFQLDRRNAFFDSGTYGTLLENHDPQRDPPTIFFVDVDTTSTNPELIGIGSVREVARGQPGELWRQYGSMSSWPDESSFSRYRSIKRRMTVIVFDDLRPVRRLGAGLPVIGHSWTYVPAEQAYEITRRL